MTTLPRAEVREALRARGLVLEATVSGTARDGPVGPAVPDRRRRPRSSCLASPAHWLEGERAWVREVCARLDAGHYAFAGRARAPIEGRSTASGRRPSGAGRAA